MIRKNHANKYSLFLNREANAVIGLLIANPHANQVHQMAFINDDFDAVNVMNFIMLSRFI